MNREEALRDCMMHSGWDASTCAEVIDASMVDGTYCDGSVVLTEAGRRCVPRSVVERKIAQHEAPVAPPVVPPPPSPPWLVPMTLSLAFRLLCALSDIASDA